MGFSNYAFIYLGVGTEDPAIQRAEIEHDGLRTTIVAVPTKAAVVTIALELMESGAESIELCGAFGPIWTARVIEALGASIPVGGVAFGMESVHALADMFPKEA